MASTSNPVIVLVPGFWEGPTVYHQVQQSLRASGYTTATATLPSTGTSSPGNPSLDDDSNAIKDLLSSFADAGKEIILVLHSAGGAIGSQAMEGLAQPVREKEGKSGGVVHIVFLAGSVFPKGFLGTAEIMPFFEVQGNKLFCKDVRNAMFNDFSDEEAEKWLKEFQCQPSEDYFREVAHLGWTEVPSTYLVLEDDHVVPAFMQEQAAAMAGSKIERCKSGHMVILKRPDVVVEVIEKVIKEIAP